MKNLVIVGAGGLGQEIIYLVEAINNQKKRWKILGFIDDNKELHGQRILEYKVLGGLNLLENYVDKNIINKEKTTDENLLKEKDAKELYCVVAISNYKAKKNIVEKIKDKVNFANLVHPEVYIHESNTLGEGVIIYPGVILTVDIKVGNHVIISPKCGIGHNSIIKDYASLLWNVNISGNTVIEEGVLMGSGSTLIQNKRVGKGAIIGAGAVVVKDIIRDSISVGIPAKPIKV